MPEDTFPGRFRASVADNLDPLRLGRVRLLVPDVLDGLTSTWALPSMPVTGPNMGIWAVPPVGAAVWVEFEQGDVDYPIWTGGWWSQDSDVPTEAHAEDVGRGNILLQTAGGTLVLLSDAAGSEGGIHLSVKGGCSIVITDAEIRLQARSGASIVLNDAGITLDNGSAATIALQGPSVSVNDDALSVT